MAVWCDLKHLCFNKTTWIYGQFRSNSWTTDSSFPRHSLCLCLFIIRSFHANAAFCLQWSSVSHTAQRVPSVQEVTSQSRKMHPPSAWTDGAAAWAETTQATFLHVTFMNQQKSDAIIILVTSGFLFSSLTWVFYLHVSKFHVDPGMRNTIMRC